MKCDFSFNHYRQMLKEALKAGFEFTNFRDFDRVKKNRIILLRHDVDSFPKRHLKIAQIEHDLGIKSTFFVRVHGEYYQPFDKVNFLAIKEIIKLGHEIGLHTEARVFSKIYRVNAVSIFQKEKKILEDLFDIEIETSSEHAEYGRPKNFWDNHFFRNRDVKSLGIKFHPFMGKFKKLKYLSDSLGTWREGCLCQNLEKFSKIQLLVHADIWGKNALKDLAAIDSRYKKFL